jgi:ABC-type phosphate transport system substrate-binding protein
MRKLTVLAVAAALTGLPGAPAPAADITGAGSTFVFPILSKWSAAYGTPTDSDAAAAWLQPKPRAAAMAAV